MSVRHLTSNSIALDLHIKYEHELSKAWITSMNGNSEWWTEFKAPLDMVFPDNQLRWYWQQQKQLNNTQNHKVTQSN